MEKIYNTNFSSKMWGIICLIFCVFLIYAFLIGIQKMRSSYGGLIISSLITGGLFLFFLTKGITEITKRIIISGNYLNYQHVNNNIIAICIGKKKEYSILDCSTILSIMEVSREVTKNPLSGRPYSLEITRKEGDYTFCINDIRSFERYEEFYHELEKLTKKKIKKNVQVQKGK